MSASILFCHLCRKICVECNGTVFCVPPFMSKITKRRVQTPKRQSSNTFYSPLLPRIWGKITPVRTIIIRKSWIRYLTDQNLKFFSVRTLQLFSKVNMHFRPQDGWDKNWGFFGKWFRFFSNAWCVNMCAMTNLQICRT